MAMATATATESNHHDEGSNVNFAGQRSASCSNSDNHGNRRRKFSNNNNQPAAKVTQHAARANSMCDAVVVATTLQAGAAPLATAAVVQQPVKENVTASLQTRKATINQQGQQWCCNIAATGEMLLT